MRGHGAVHVVHLIEFCMSFGANCATKMMGGSGIIKKKLHFMHADAGMEFYWGQVSFVALFA